MSSGGGDEDVDEPEEITIGSVLQAIVVVVVVAHADDEDDSDIWTAALELEEAAVDDAI